MSAFWSAFVIVITVGSLVGCLWLLFANAKGAPGEDTGHVWDDDLREKNNPLPRWWLNLFVITIVFSAGYLVLYPGLGNFAGTLGWTSAGQTQAGLDAIQAKRKALYAKFQGEDVAALSKDAAAKPLGREIFLRNCAGCHGADAHGAVGFPNLTDNDWLYGGAPDQIVATITNGRHGAMPAFNGALGAETIATLAQFVPRWSDPKLDAGTRGTGEKQFATTCAACHGAEGRGNPLLGAPNLRDDTWLYGGTAERVRETITFGRNGAMPAHADLLSPDDIRLVAAYVYGLSDHAP